MSLALNAFPILFPEDAEINLCMISYEKDRLDQLRQNHSDTHTFKRERDKIFCFSSDENYPISGEKSVIKIKNNYRLLSYLFKDGLVRTFKGTQYTTRGFRPIELISSIPNDNILKQIVTGEFPFNVLPKYELDVRILKGRPCLVIDSSSKRVTVQNCSYFIDKGFDIKNRYITQHDEKGYNKLIGMVTTVEKGQISYHDKLGNKQTISTDATFLEANVNNFNDFMSYSFGNKAPQIIEKIRIQLSIFNSGEKKRNEINKLLSSLTSKEIKTITGIMMGVGKELDVTTDCRQFEKPVFIFNDSGEASWAEKGFTQFGPYTKRTFDRNDPSVCVICSKQNKGGIEQFVRKFLKGINGHKYFSRGLEGKFHIGTSRVEFFTFDNDTVESYKKAIETAIQKKTQDGGKWDLALVQVKQIHKELPVNKNPYFVGKSIFFLHQIPVQDFTLELLGQSENSLGYSLNNMGLATYAKMGGVPWLLKASPTLSHELVVGIGSAYLQQDRLSPNQRIMGITTVFSGDGSYIVSNTSDAVPPDQYRAALTNVLENTLEKIRIRRNWQKGDTIRIIFHASVKKFNRDEIEAVRSVVASYKDFNVEFSFLKISEHHGLHMFDTSSSFTTKGKYAPLRGKFLKLSDYEVLVYLIGKNEIRQTYAGHPRGLILSVHKESNFTDIKYLSAQLFNFSSHSWRSYFPNPMPVTISYSDLIAQKLGWLEKVPGWNSSVMIGKLGQTQWFL